MRAKYGCAVGVAIPFSPISPDFSPMGEGVDSPSKDLIAVCLTCGNEWVVRTPNAPGGKRKKRKCPVCGKYRIRMKSELEEKGDDAGAGTTSVAVIPPKPPKPVPTDVPVDLLIEDEDEADDGREHSGGSMIVVAGAVVLLVGAAWFGWSLLRRRRRRRVETVSEQKRNTELATKRYQRLPAVPGF